MDKHKVTVVITSYNYGHYLGEAIQSVIDQTFKDFELIVVDNCSTDNSVEIVKDFMENDKRIKLVKNKTNIGLNRNYNEALLQAEGEYIKFLNADDKFHPQILEKFVKILDDHPSVSLVTSFRQEFGAGGKTIATEFEGMQNGKKMILLALSKLNFIGEPSTVMFRKANLNLGLFDISLLLFADLDMWLRQLSVGDLYIVNEVLSYVRKHEEQGTQQLRGDIDKSVFIRFEWAEYVHNSILTNRFGFNIYDEDEKVRKKILKKSTKVVHRLLFSNSKHNQRVRDYFVSIRWALYLRYFIKHLFKKVI